MDAQRTRKLLVLGMEEGRAELFSKLCGQLVEKAAGGVTGLVVYGSLARGRYEPATSDINLAVILRDAMPGTLQAIAGPLRDAFRALRVEPFLLTADDVVHGADVFPIKFQDIALHHEVLYGESPFVGLKVSRAHLRLRIEQELRNMSLRLRRRYVALVEEPEALGAVIADMTPGFAIELSALMALLGKQAAKTDAPADVIAAAAAAFDWPKLAHAGEAHPGPRAAEAIRAEAEALMAAMHQAAQLANGAPEGT